MTNSFSQGETFLIAKEINLLNWGRTESLFLSAGTLMIVVEVDPDEMPEGYKVFFEGTGDPESDWIRLSAGDIDQLRQPLLAESRTVFLCTMKQTGSKKKSTGSVIIAESEGRWLAGWSTQGTEKIDETWYIGESWEELLTSFRNGVGLQCKKGFVPIVPATLN